MPYQIELKVRPEQVVLPDEIKEMAAEELKLLPGQISHIKVLRKSLDARQPQIVFLLKLEVYVTGEIPDNSLRTFAYRPVSEAKTCHIIGIGPAGIYAAFQLLELGIKPIILERGKPSRERVKDLSALNRKRIVNPESNYCFGEGGAGTYSDGKLYTRSTKRGDLKKVLDVLIQHGADERIAYEAHPHIGTNKLPRIIENMRQSILEQGGEIHFHTKLTGLQIKDGRITALLSADGKEWPCRQVILATGHSARDIFELLHQHGILIEAKPFALGVRIEHPQEVIDAVQYKCSTRGEFLPAASYNLVTQVEGHGVFSFCMCPGGVICPAATNANETVVNGWSSSQRNGPYANSGVVVAVNESDWLPLREYGPLAALEFQKRVEQKAFAATGSIEAPAQRMEDFIRQKSSPNLPRTSYLPGIASYDLREILPGFIDKSLRQALLDFDKKMPGRNGGKGYRTNEAVLVGVESRTSSPVRIPRSKETYRHPQISNLLPCGEGAGYAGGIVSAAMDGMACANAAVL